MNGDIPKTYDENRAPEDFLREQKENDDAHKVEGEDTVIKEDIYIDTCEECGRHLFTEVETLSYEDREMFKCGYKTLRVNGKILCPSCILTAFWVNGKSSITIGGIMEDKNLVVRDAIVMPAVTAEKALEAWNAYQDLKKKIAEPSDKQKIQGRDFLKKSYWRKIATFFNLSVEMVEEKTETVKYLGIDVLAYHFRARATANNGRFAEGTGSCDIYDHATIKDGKFMVYDKYKKGFKEAEPKSIHNARTTAETRAWNRAVSNLVGGGEVSAEEIKEEIITNGHEEHLNIPEDVIEKTLDKEKERVTEELKDNIQTPICVNCDKELTVKVYNYSMQKFGKALCYDCQKKG